MAFSEVELALRKELLKAVAERDKIATTCVTLRAEVLSLKTEVAKHEQVHTLCADAINQLTAKNAALEALARQMKEALTHATLAVQVIDEPITPVEQLAKQKCDEAIAACAKFGLVDPPRELTP